LPVILARARGSGSIKLRRIQPVINGTGVIVHTNLGRAPLGPAVVETLALIA
jgi:L-seryl-tRNA(Ser) seleniumtransferase